MQKKTKYICNLLLIVSFAGLLCLTCCNTPITDKKGYAFYENRALALLPTYSDTNFWNGQYFSDWETYLKDHVAGRDFMLEKYAYINRNVLKKPVVGDVLLSNDGKKLLPATDFRQPDVEEIDAKAEEMSSRLSVLNELVSSYGGKFLYVGVPEQKVYFEQLYPSYMDPQAEASQLRQDVFFNSLKEHDISFLDMGQVFERMGHPDWIYSSTDHHYSYYGAYHTYQAIMDTINQERETPLYVLTPSELEFQTLPNPFLGSRNRKDFGQFENEDALVIGVPKQDIPFRRYNRGTEDEPSLYDIPENPEDWVTYDCYNGGNRIECIIDTDRPELPTLLMFGDSFTNPLETLLYTGFDKSIYVDLREIKYLNQGILGYVEQYHPDYVICVRDSGYYLDLTGNGVIGYEPPAEAAQQ